MSTKYNPIKIRCPVCSSEEIRMDGDEDVHCVNGHYFEDEHGNYYNGTLGVCECAERYELNI